VQDGNTLKILVYSAGEQKSSIMPERNTAGSIRPQSQRLWGSPLVRCCLTLTAYSLPGEMSDMTREGDGKPEGSQYIEGSEPCVGMLRTASMVSG